MTDHPSSRAQPPAQDSPLARTIRLRLGGGMLALAAGTAAVVIAILLVRTALS